MIDGRSLALTKIVSGGQTGADQGALSAARKLRISTGGTAPRGWLTETGPQETMLKSFGLVECNEPGYAARTRKNVLDGDGTLLLGPYESGGVALTATAAKEANKPFLHIDITTPIAPNDERIVRFRSWLQEFDIRTLNVAGNRETHSPGIQSFTTEFLSAALQP
jgi:hypothetical protein